LMEPEVSVIVETCTPRELYNFLLQTGILIIDVRSDEEYKQMHIKTSFNLDVKKILTTSNTHKLQADDIEKQVLTLKVSDRSRWKQRGITSVVIYGDNKENKSCALELYEYLKAEKKATKMKILLNGYNHFYEAYPYLCLQSPKENEDGIPITTIKSVSEIVPANMTFPSEIIENFLFLGGILSADKMPVLKLLNITRIVNTAGELANMFHDEPEFAYMKVPVDDYPSTIIKTYFEETFNFIEKAQAENKRVLVHCAMGISRSSTICIGYLVAKKGYTLWEAYNLIKTARPFIKPNPGFCKQLIELELQVHNQISCQPSVTGNGFEK